MAHGIQNLIDFVSFTHQIREVKRAMWVKDEETYENDSEHGYQIAMVAMFVIEERKLQLDVYKCMALALVHDVIEVYSGDTHAFGPQEHLDTKAERESAARKQLEEDWPGLSILHQLVDEYEERKSQESRFVYALDKVVPIINNYLDNGRNWKKDNITLYDHVGSKTQKVAVDPTVAKYYEEIMKILETRPDLFPLSA